MKGRITTGLLAAAVLAGCTTLTPESAWETFGRYYTDKGVKSSAEAAETTVAFRGEADPETDLAAWTQQGYVEAGRFTIEDGTDISPEEVRALGMYLKADTALFFRSLLRREENPGFGESGSSRVGFDGAVNPFGTGNSIAPSGTSAHDVYRYVALMLVKRANVAGAAAKISEKQERKMMKVEMKTSLGTIELELDAEKAPVTVKNFADYAKAGHYDGTIFHRVIGGFMVQGGGFTPDMRQKATNEPIKNEAMNGLKNARGTIAMARTQVVDSATSQFFINLVDNAFLDFRSPTPSGFGYCVFGKVTAGMEVVDKIAAVKTGSRGMHQDVPVEAVTIEKVTVVE